MYFCPSLFTDVISDGAPSLAVVISRRGFDLFLIKYFRDLRFKCQPLNSELFYSFIKDGISFCRSVQEKCRFLARHGLSDAPNNSTGPVTSREFEDFLLDLSGDCDPVDDPVSYVKYWVQSQPDSFHFSHISAERMCAEVRSITRKRCAGYDGVSVTQVFHSLSVSAQLLTDLYNRVVAESKFPDCWKLTPIRPIPKTPMLRGPSDLRPIALQPIFEEIAFKELTKYMEDNSKWDDQQFGFRAVKVLFWIWWRVFERHSIVGSLL